MSHFGSDHPRPLKHRSLIALELRYSALERRFRYGNGARKRFQIHPCDFYQEVNVIGPDLAVEHAQAKALACLVQPVETGVAIARELEH